MAVATFINLIHYTVAGPQLTAADHWDGYIAVVPAAISGGMFQGYCLDWGGFNNLAVLDSFNNLGYSGYSTNWGGEIAPGPTTNAFANSPYAGYTTNWGQYTDPINASVFDVDMDSIIDHPKDQIIYYKLKGWNASTQQYESWVISHNVTGRVSLDGNTYDPIPGRSAPNVERDIFKTPPSGNTLSNIIIVARWFE